MGLWVRLLTCEFTYRPVGSHMGFAYGCVGCLYGPVGSPMSLWVRLWACGFAYGSVGSPIGLWAYGSVGFPMGLWVRLFP